LLAFGKMYSIRISSQSRILQSRNHGPLDMFGSIRHAAKLKEIKIRMKTVKSIQKITKTMKMIASSRVKGAESRMKNSRPFGASISGALNSLPDVENLSGTTTLFVPITSDRGLCGSLNTQVVRETRKLIGENTNASGNSVLVVVGDKGVAQLQRDLSAKILFSVSEVTKSTNFTTFADIAEEILRRSYDRIVLLYNRFNTVLSFTVTPVSLRTQSHIQKMIETGHTEKLNVYEFEDELREDHSTDMGEFALAGVLYSAYLDNQTSELGARMTSMDNASRNAGEVSKGLVLKYNRGRQTTITTELIEIISGAEAIKVED